MLVWALALGTLPGHAAGPTANASAWSAADGEVIVGFKPQASVTRKHALSARAPAATVQTALAQRAASLGQRVGRTLESGSAVGEAAQVMRSPGVDAATLARQLAADPDVAYAVPNGRKYKVAAPNDPLYTSGPAVNLSLQTGGPNSGQWYLRAPDSTIKSAINIEAAWARTTGRNSVVVAVLDTGVRFEHPDLGRVANGGQLLPGYDMVTNSAVANDGDGPDADPSDPGDWISTADAATSTFTACDVSGSSWHGTSTAALVAAAANTSPATGMAGAAPGVRVLPVRVLGKCFGRDSDIINGMLWAAGISVPGLPVNANPAKVINMSLGGGISCQTNYQDAVNQIVARGVTIVAAAGNSAGGPVSEPANCRGVVAVLALRHAGSKVGFSDLGSEIAIAAPGGNCINTSSTLPCLYPILSATNTGSQGPVASAWTNSFDYTVGTSFSSPLVAGVVALMASQQPNLTVAQIRSALQSSARPFPTTGADNGAGEPPVAQCQAPVSGIDQLQCYCNTSFCGAGMLDAGQAVAAVSGAFARIDITTTTPTAGASVALSAAGSLASPGASVTQYAWTLSNGGGVVTGFSSATNASTATLLPTVGGNFTVQLTVTDSAGQSNSVSQLVAVAAAPTPAPQPGTPPATGGGSGGGASSPAWVAGVGLAAALLLLLRLQARNSGTRASVSPSRRKA